MTTADIQTTIRSRLNELRILDRIVNSTEFLQCLKLNPNNPRLARAIVEADLDAVREWMDEVIKEEVCEMSIRQLRLVAAQLGIKAYTGLPKDDLLILIVQKKHELREAKEHVGGVPSGTNGVKAVFSQS